MEIEAVTDESASSTIDFQRNFIEDYYGQNCGQYSFKVDQSQLGGLQMTFSKSGAQSPQNADYFDTISIA